MDLELSVKLSDLLNKSQGGDVNAYSEFLHAIYSLVERAVMNKLKLNREDVVQEVILSIHSARHSYDPSREFYPWFYAIVNARIIDEKRRLFRVARKVDAFRLDVESREAEGLRKASLEEDLKGVLESLPEKQKKVLKLSKVHGFSMKEIAEEMGSSIENVKVIAHRGLGNLKKVFKDGSDG